MQVFGPNAQEAQRTPKSTPTSPKISSMCHTSLLLRSGTSPSGSDAWELTWEFVLACLVSPWGGGQWAVLELLVGDLRKTLKS